MEVKMNKEIRNYQESMFMGLNLRQCIFSLLAIAVAVGIYFGLGKYVGQEMTGWLCILGAAPFAACGFFQYHGMNAEQFAWAYIKSEFLYPKRLLFQSEDLYHACMEETLALGEKTRGDGAALLKKREQRAGKESAFAAYRGGKKLAVKTYEKLKEQRQKQREAVTAPLDGETGNGGTSAQTGQARAKKGRTGAGRSIKVKPEAEKTIKEAGNRAVKTAPRMVKASPVSYNLGNLTKKTGSNIYEGGKGSKTGCHAFCPGSKTKRRGGKNNCQGAESYGGSCRPCGKGSFCSIDGRRWYGICDLDPYCRNHWRRFVYREFPEQ